jgi:hypothetical protein
MRPGLLGWVANPQAYAGIGGPKADRQPAPRPRRVLKAFGLTHSVYSHFEEPELLDDLRDHWVGLDCLVGAGGCLSDVGRLEGSGTNLWTGCWGGWRPLTLLALTHTQTLALASRLSQSSAVHRQQLPPARPPAR